MPRRRENAHGNTTEQEKNILLIQMYAVNQSLWNPRHEDYYHRFRREETWDVISETLGAPKQELIAKMRSLAGSYRRERHRVKKAKDDPVPYKSKWYAYEHFEFLKDKDPFPAVDADLAYCNNCYNTIGHEDAKDSTDENEDTETQPTKNKTTKKRRTEDPLSNTANPSKRKLSDADENKSHNTVEKSTQKSDDNEPYTSFGLYIASELRKYDPHTLANVKHAINNVIFHADVDFYRRDRNGNASENTNEEIGVQHIIFKTDVDSGDDECE